MTGDSTDTGALSVEEGISVAHVDEGDVSETQEPDAYDGSDNKQWPGPIEEPGPLFDA
jgi:hypothetical protein